MWIYCFDGTFAGLLTAVFEYYERKHQDVCLVSERLYSPGFLEQVLHVTTDQQKAERVWKGLSKHLDKAWLSRLYASFLGEQEEGYRHLFKLIIYIFNDGGEVVANYGNPHVLYIVQLERKVHREKHRMEAFVRFQKLSDNTFFATVEPDYNVLPLIKKHFQYRYADQVWTIYDHRRTYGIHYAGNAVSEVTIDFSESDDALSPSMLAEDEVLYQRLWKGYFQHTNIASRKNTKLHIQHVPKRYWKYLTEKL